jgi:hypothetical protein
MAVFYKNMPTIWLEDLFLHKRFLVNVSSKRFNKRTLKQLVQTIEANKYAS